MVGTPEALLITQHNAVVELDLPHKSKDRLTLMRAVLRCDSVDVVALTTRIDIWFDDEYPYNYEEEMNVVATLLTRRFIPDAAPIHGPVLLTGGVDENGDIIPISREKVVALMTAMADSVTP